MPSSSGSSRPGDYVVSLPCLYWQVGSLPVAPPGSAFTCSVCSAAQLCRTLCDPRGLWPDRLLCPWDSPGKDSGVGCHFLFQGVFPTQGPSPRHLHLLRWQVILYH